MAIARVTSKGQVTIPVEVRRTLEIEEGDELLFEVHQDGQATVQVLKRGRLGDLFGALPATRAYSGKEAVRDELGRVLGSGTPTPEPKR